MPARWTTTAAEGAQGAVLVALTAHVGVGTAAALGGAAESPTAARAPDSAHPAGWMQR